jgi:hypothetical protein
MLYLQPVFTDYLLSLFFDPYTESALSSETPVDYYQTTRRHSSEDTTLLSINKLYLRRLRAAP